VEELAQNKLENPDILPVFSGDKSDFQGSLFSSIHIFSGSSILTISFSFYKSSNKFSHPYFFMDVPK